MARIKVRVGGQWVTVGTSDDDTLDRINALELAVDGINLDIPVIEGDITALDGRLDVAEPKITALEGRYKTLPSWTPTWLGITVGNGSVLAKYQQVGHLVVGFASITLGSTTSISANPGISLPVVCHADYIKYDSVGQIQIWDNGGNIYNGILQMDGATGPSTVGRFRVLNHSSGSYTYESLLGGTVPVTYASGDRITVSFAYLANAAV